MLQVCHIDSRIILLILFLLAVVLLAVRFWSTSNSNEIMNACAAAGESQGTVAATTSSQTSPPLYLSLNAYRHLNKLSYLGLGDRVEGASTADPGGSSADNWHVVRVLQDGEHVLFDQLGPGIMTFMRMQENYGGPWNLSLDGHFTTTVNASDLGQTNPVSGPASTLPYPLSLNPQQSQGSSIVATPIPFQQSMQWWGTFHATYTGVVQSRPGQDMTFLDVKGSGKLVGTVINFSVPDNTLEGDPHIYLDDSETPQIAATGTEEWGLGGNYWNGGQQVSLPLGGLPSSINNPPGMNIDGATLYRFLIADSIPFNRHLIVRWEHGGRDESTHPYRATMLWYGTPTQTALLSDNVLPVVPASRLAHHYVATGEHTYQLSAAYEYLVHTPLITATGTILTGAASFTMQLDPRNVGAFLRRTFDDCIGNQGANIYLDSSFAGTWYDAGASNGVGVDGHQRCWRDEDFPLPASLTAGKSSVNVCIVFLPTTNPQNGDWTAFRYSMYSFVLLALPSP